MTTMTEFRWFLLILFLFFCFCLSSHTTQQLFRKYRLFQTMHKRRLNLLRWKTKQDICLFALFVTVRSISHRHLVGFLSLSDCFPIGNHLTFPSLWHIESKISSLWMSHTKRIIIKTRIIFPFFLRILFPVRLHSEAFDYTPMDKFKQTINWQ